MGNFSDAFGPTGWVQSMGVEKVWSKTLRSSEEDQSLALVRYEPGAELPLHTVQNAHRMLLLEGYLEAEIQCGVGDVQNITYRRGAFLRRPPNVESCSRSPEGCLFLLSTEPAGESGGVELPEETLTDAFGPGGWYPTPNVDLKSTVQGVWNKPLHIETEVESWPEMYMHRTGHSLYAVYFEPGAIYPMHHHPYAQQLLFIEGDAQDEIVDEDARRLTATYGRGSFVDYPYPMQHATFSKQGCRCVLGT